MPDCLAIDFDYGPVAWRCNQPAGHYPDSPHAFVQLHITQHEWIDEGDA